MIASVFPGQYPPGKHTVQVWVSMEYDPGSHCTDDGVYEHAVLPGGAPGHGRVADNPASGQYVPAGQSGPDAVMLTFGQK